MASKEIATRARFKRSFEPRMVLYVFLDVVEFTKMKTVEAQMEAVFTLDSFVNSGR